MKDGLVSKLLQSDLGSSVKNHLSNFGDYVKRGIVLGSAVAYLSGCGKGGSVVGPKPPVPPTSPPRIVSQAPSSVTEGDTLRYQIVADNASKYGSNLEGSSTNSGGLVTYVAPHVSSDSTINKASYFAIAGTDTAKQVAPLTIKKKIPQKPIVDLTSIFKKGFNEEQVYKVNLPDTAQDGEKIHYVSVTDQNGVMKLSLNNYELTAQSKNISQDEIASVKYDYTSDKTGLSNSTTAKDTVKNFLDFDIALQTIDDHNSNVLGIGKVSWDSSGTYVPFKDISINNDGQKVKGGDGKMYLTTGSDGKFDFQVNDKSADQLGLEKVVFEAVKGGIKQITSSEAYDALGGYVSFWVGKETGSESFVRTEDYTLTKKPTDSEVSNKIVRVTPFGNVINWDGNATLTPPQYTDFFGNINTEWNNGNLVKYNTPNVEIVKHSPIDATTFSNAGMKDVYTAAKELSDAISNKGERAGLNIVEDSTIQHGHFDKGYGSWVPDKGYWVIVPVAPNSKFLYNGKAVANTDTKTPTGFGGKGAFTWIQNNFTYYSQFNRELGVPLHEGGLGLFAPNEIQNSNWSNKTITEWATNLSAPSDLDKKAINVVYEESYKNGEDQDKILGLYFGILSK